MSELLDHAYIVVVLIPASIACVWAAVTLIGTRK